MGQFDDKEFHEFIYKRLYKIIYCLQYFQNVQGKDACGIGGGGGLECISSQIVPDAVWWTPSMYCLVEASDFKLHACPFIVWNANSAWVA